MGKKPDGPPYINYYISMLLGYCHGPVDQFMQLTIKDKTIFEEDGSESYTEQAVIPINEPDLFGGNLREGGLVGTMEYMPGGITQLAPQSLADRVGLTPTTMPGFRGQAVLWFHGDDNSGAKGFRVGSNSPSVPAIEARFRRASRTLDNNVPIILSPDETRHNSNPANMIWECFTDTTWGMSGVASQLDMASFNAAAQTLNDENFGMSLLWDVQSPIEDFVQNILNHINGIYFFNPFTGKGVLKLLRDDYDVDSLPELGPDNCVLDTFRRPLWGETINEITLSWTNPKTEDDETITFQDLGNIAMQGDVSPDTRDFAGIRDRALAGDVCSRELRQAAAPLASAKIKVDRRKQTFLPGDVFAFRWPERDIERIIMRVLDIDWGTVDNALITLNCLEDIFGLPYAKFEEPSGTTWEPPGKDPDDPLFEGFEYMFRATPYSLLATHAPFFGGYTFDDTTYNLIGINSYVLPTDAQFDLGSYLLYRPGIDTLGDETWNFIGEKWVVGHTALAQAIGEGVTTTIKLDTMIGPGDWPREKFMGFFVGADEFTDELFTFVARTEEGDWIIRRGILDTIPRAWPAGTKVIIQSTAYNGYDFTERFADTSERYRFKIRTSLGISEFSPPVSTVRPDRPYRPYRPANVKIVDTMFGLSDEGQFIDPADVDMFKNRHEPRTWQVHCSWSRRNRFTEDKSWLAWDDADVTPEIDQTTEIIIYAGDEEIDRIVGITGTSYDLDLTAHTGRLTSLRLKFISRRPHPDVPEGLESLQGVTIKLRLYYKGFGSDYDYLWGGWPDLEENFMTDIEDANMVGLLGRMDGELDND